MNGQAKNEEDEDKQPLDDLLSLRGKPFADWKEEREYLRGKWGEQGKKIDLAGEYPGNEKPKGKERERE